MKKLAILFLFILKISTGLIAQEEAPKVRIGLVASPGLSWIKSNNVDLEGDGVSFAFGYGLHAEFKITKNIYFSTGILQSNFAGKVHFKDSVRLTFNTTVDGEPVENYATIINRTYNFNSIELPIKLKLKTPEIGYFTYFIELGLNANLIYKSNSKDNNVLSISSPDITSEDLAKIDAEGETNWYRFGSLINAGFEYNFAGNTSLLVSANWSNSFLSILNDKPENLNYIKDGLKGNAFNQNGNLNLASLTVGIIF